MKSIALYGYGRFGKRTAESFRLFWGETYRVSAIFDKNQYGEKDEYWDLYVLSPNRIEEEYDKGIFDAVMVCIFDQETRAVIEKQLEELGIPTFVTGKKQDFASHESFRQDRNPVVSIQREGYNFCVYKNMFGALADSDRQQIVFLFDRNGRLNIDHYKAYRSYFEPLLLMYPFRLKDPIPEKVYMKGSYCVISKAFSDNYWHFTCEMADCVFLLESAGYRGKYVFNDRPFARELFQMMEISADRLISTKELDLHKVYVFERLFDINRYSVASEREAKYSVTVISEMAAVIKKKLTIDESSSSRIYIKRIGKRKLLNGEAIAKRNGFKIIVPEEYSIKEQMNLFYNADIVLCPHGANSTNCLYMRRGAVFIEVFSNRWHMVINKELSEANGVHYFQIVGEACKNMENDFEADYYVDEDALQHIIQAAEEKINAKMKE